MDAHQERPKSKHTRSAGLTIGEWLLCLEMRLRLAGLKWAEVFAGPGTDQAVKEEFDAGKTPEETAALLVALQRAAAPPR